MKPVVRLQLLLGFLYFLSFLVTGIYLSARVSYVADEGVRMMYRATHCYLLFGSLLNLVAGMSAPSHRRGYQLLEIAGRVSLMIVPAGFLLAFFLEPPKYAIDRPITLPCVIAAVVGVALFSLGRSRLLSRLRRVFLVSTDRGANDVQFREALLSDGPRLHQIRAAAFAPIFNGFREALGAELYSLVQEDEDLKQGEILDDCLAEASGWVVLVAEQAGEPIGFVCYRCEPAKRIAEIGLNAIHPSHAGNGLGTQMYEHVVRVVRHQGMLAVTVATGGDEAHAPARRAYEKAGFDRRIPGIWYCRLL